MVPIGNRPILIHLMRYYAHYGHTEFILCLGYKAEVIKEYFLHYEEALHNDFVLTNGKGSRAVNLLHSDIENWRITFVDTGMQANVGQRLKAIAPHIGDDEYFLANYADGLTDLPLPCMIEASQARGAIANFLCVKPTSTMHLVSMADDGLVRDIQPVTTSDIWVNGGYFVLRRAIFDYIGAGEELVEEPFRRLIAEGQLVGHRYEGFWMPMDTFKDQQTLEALYQSGRPPWEVWRAPQPTPLAVGAR
jgi:glucose-1-phosphate cytidylyltransferase